MQADGLLLGTKVNKDDDQDAETSLNSQSIVNVYTRKSGLY